MSKPSPAPAAASQLGSAAAGPQNPFQPAPRAPSNGRFLRRAGPAAPPWLTLEQHAQILAIYQEAQSWTEQTGIKHSVDHLVPLEAQSRGIHYLCSLHVPCNLRAPPEHLNRDRSDWFPVGDRPTDDEDFDF